MGSEDPLQNLLKGIFVQEGSSGGHFGHGQFEIKTFPIYAPPYYIPRVKIPISLFIKKCGHNLTRKWKAGKLARGLLLYILGSFKFSLSFVMSCYVIMNISIVGNETERKL